MSEVRAFKPYEQAVPAEYKEPLTGCISAYVMVEAIGFNGLKVFRRVRIGHEFGVTPETAKAMVDNVREANAAGVHYNNPPIISGRFIMDL